MTRLERFSHGTFASLAIPNYRLYFAGQSLSLVGTWMQTIASSFLVLHLTGSGFAVGLIVALQTLPVLLLGPYAGVVADRVDKRKLMIVLQTLMGVQALVFGVLTITHVITMWQIAVLALTLGLNNAFENPARQTFILEMVGPKDLRNAVTLNSVMVNVARAVGPAIAGIIIAAGGYGICFMLNAASFVAVVCSLVKMDISKLTPTEPAPRTPGQLREGLRYVRSETGLWVPLVMMAIVGCFAYEFQVTLPVIAAQTFHGGSQAYGFMTAAMGVGAIGGGLYAAGRGHTGLKSLTKSAVVFTVVLVIASWAPTLPVELVALAGVGAASVTFLSKGNSTLQLAAAPQMRGRVMALWAVAFLGSTPIGGPVAGAVAQFIGPRYGLVLAAVACAVAAVIGVGVMRSQRQAQAARQAETPESAAEAEAELEVAAAGR